MKKFLVLLSLLFSSFTYADTINLHWRNYDGTTYQNSTCVIDGDLIIPATTPTRYGYTFTGWKIGNYIPIGYLESTGTQYIDTGFKPDTNSRMILDFYTVKSNNSYIALVQNGSNDYGFGVSQDVGASSAFLVKYCKRLSEYWIPEASSIYGGGTGRYIVDLNKTVTKITAMDTSVINHIFPITIGSSLDNLLLFAGNYDGVVKLRTENLRIYSCKLYDNDTLVRDFIPVLDRDSVPCMYDKVTEQFFYNQGTGQFIAGPVL